MDVTDNSPQGGTDSAQPSTEIDNPASWDYYDPDEEQDNVAPKEAAGTEGETAETTEEVVQEAEGQDTQEETAEPETAETETQAAVKEASEDMLVTLRDGTKIPVAELRNGYMRQDHFTRERQKDAQTANYLQQVSQQIEQFVMAQIPPPPDPQLAYSNPAEYVQQQAQHEAARRHWADVTQLKEQAEQGLNAVQQAEHQRVLATERDLLIQKLPALKEPKGWADFMVKAMDVAKQAGVSEDEFKTFSDHRYFAVLDLAIEGATARKAKQVAKQKVATVPPVAPPKRQVVQNSAVVKNRDAMRKLSQSGSIRDALQVDFD